MIDFFVKKWYNNIYRDLLTVQKKEVLHNAQSRTIAVRLFLNHEGCGNHFHHRRCSSRNRPCCPGCGENLQPVPLKLKEGTFSKKEEVSLFEFFLVENYYIISIDYL